MNTYANFDQNIPNDLRGMSIFYLLVTDGRTDRGTPPVTVVDIAGRE